VLQLRLHWSGFWRGIGRTGRRFIAVKTDVGRESRCKVSDEERAAGLTGG